LLALRDLRHVVFDKTGTLTTGAMQLRAVHCAAGMDEAAARRWAAMLESGITHPIARALCAGRSEAPAPAQTLLPQGGVGGDLDGVPGSLRPVVAPATGADPAAEGLRWVRLERNGQRVADFGFAEVLRPEALAVVSELQARGLTVHLLSGDAHVPVTRLAAALRIDGVHAGAQPEDKLARVRAWQAEGGRVLMVGDGINDGPTLAAADVAVSLGGGASLAQGQGDLLLLRDDLRGLLALLEVAQSTRRIALQNVLWALGYNLTLVPLAFMGWIAPAMAALGMGGSSLLVTLSALRLLRTPAPDLSVAPAVRESAA
ncbi:MAG: HAD-IC family P-type ATPase, partial [Oceanococcaceae bacterium]